MFRASLVAHSESCLLCGHNLLINEQINDVSFIIRDKENVWLKAVCFRLNAKRLLCFHVQLPAVQKPLATILHFQITLTFFYSVLFWGVGGVGGGSHQEIPQRVPIPKKKNTVSNWSFFFFWAGISSFCLNTFDFGDADWMPLFAS